jgi:hypothetical protein
MRAAAWLSNASGFVECVFLFSEEFVIALLLKGECPRILVDGTYITRRPLGLVPIVQRDIDMPTTSQGFVRATTDGDDSKQG